MIRIIFLLLFILMVHSSYSQKKDWTILERTALLTSIINPVFDVSMYCLECKEHNLGVRFFTTDTFFLKDDSLLFMKGRDFFTLLYLFLPRDSTRIIDSTIVQYCFPDSSRCRTIVFPTKSAKINGDWLTFENRLNILLSSLYFSSKYKILNEKKGRIGIEVPIILDNDVFWEDDKNMMNYFKNLSSVVYDWLLGKNKRRYEGIVCPFLRQDGTLKKTYLFYFNDHYFKKMYKRNWIVNNLDNETR